MDPALPLSAAIGKCLTGGIAAMVEVVQGPQCLHAVRHRSGKHRDLKAAVSKE